jgi:hypothetical protein
MVDLAPGVAAIMALIAQLATKDRDGERRDIGGASGQSHFGARSGIGFQELTVAGTPNLSTLPSPGEEAQGSMVRATRKPRVSNWTLILRLTRTAARTNSLSFRQEPPRATR